jgi:CheY-like chemotaxis protein
MRPKSFVRSEMRPAPPGGSGLAIRTPVNARYVPSSLPRLLAVADDDEVVAELVSTWLEHRGFRVLRFGSGDALLAWAASAPVTVEAVVLDVDMPGRDGYQSCRELRTLPSYARVPAVFVSSGPPGAVPAGLRSGTGDELIGKDAEMLDRLSSWLDRTLSPAA